MDGEVWIMGILLCILLCTAGILLLVVASLMGARLKNMRKQQFLDGWDDEWTE